MEATQPTCRNGWMKVVLLLAGVYNLVWGGIVVLAPGWSFGVLGVDPDALDAMTLAIWQCVGMIVGVYGIGYLVAARDPIRHWPIVLVGFLGKIFGPIGFAKAVFVDEIFPLRFGWTIVTNDLIWWIPFAMILVCAWRHHQSGRRNGIGEDSDG